MIDPIEYDAATDPVVDAAERERFRVADDQQAAWAMRKLASLRRRQAEIDRTAKAEVDRIEAWHVHQSAALVADTNYFTGLLTEYARVERDAHDRKTVSLPHGTIKSRAGGERVDVTDADAFVAWAERSAPTLVRVRVEPDKAAVKAAFTGDPETGAVLDPTTGEVVPGVSITRTEITYTIETE